MAALNIAARAAEMATADWLELVDTWTLALED
jgi:hypothetical protein